MAFLEQINQNKKTNDFFSSKNSRTEKCLTQKYTRIRRNFIQGFSIAQLTQRQKISKKYALQEKIQVQIWDKKRYVYNQFKAMQTKILVLFCLLSIALSVAPDNCIRVRPGISPVNGKEICRRCRTGYVLNYGANECDIPWSDPWCHQFYPNGACQQCSWRTVNISGYCTPVSDYCQTWSSTTGDCTTCYIGYELSAGDCVLSTSTVAFDPLCHIFDSNGVCTQCSFRSQFDSNGVCREVSPYCKEWDKVTRWCTSCYIGYHLNTSTGACVLD